MKRDIQVNPMGKSAEVYAAHPLLRSLLSLIPGWAAADTLLQHRAGEIRDMRTRVFFDELAEAESDLTEELIQTEDFLHCFFMTVRGAVNTRRREKIRMFARLLSSAVRSGLYTETDAYEEHLRILDTTSLVGLSLLVHATPDGRQKYEMTVWEEGPFINTRFPGLPDAVVHSAFLDVLNKGLLKRPFRGTYLHAMKIPCVVLALTPFGQTFVEKIMLKDMATDGE